MESYHFVIFEEWFMFILHSPDSIDCHTYFNVLKESRVHLIDISLPLGPHNFHREKDWEVVQPSHMPFMKDATTSDVSFASVIV